MMSEWRSQWHLGTGGATDPDMPMGFVQIGPMTNDEGDSADSFLIRMGQTANYGYAPNKAWPHAFMSTGFDLMNPPGTHCIAGCIHIFNKQAVAVSQSLLYCTVLYCCAVLCCAVLYFHRRRPSALSSQLDPGNTHTLRKP